MSKCDDCNHGISFECEGYIHEPGREDHFKAKEAEIKTGDKCTISGVGINKSGDIIRRIRNDNKKPPFWGINTRTGKRGKAIRLAALTLKGEG